MSTEILPDFVKMMDELNAEGYSNEQLSKILHTRPETIAGYRSTIKAIPDQWNVCIRLVALYIGEKGFPLPKITKEAE